MYQVTNILEKIVADAVDSILPTLEDVCTCDVCRADIICLTLNQIPPRYVTHRFGEVLSRAEFESPQKNTEVITTIMKSVRKIRHRPHDEKPSRHEATEG